MANLGAWALTLPFVLLGASLCVGAGIGGGAVYVSIYFLILGTIAASSSIKTLLETLDML